MKNLNHDAWTRSYYILFFPTIFENFSFKIGGILSLILKFKIGFEILEK